MASLSAKARGSEGINTDSQASAALFFFVFLNYLMI